MSQNESSAFTDVAVALVRTWTRLYTSVMTPVLRDARRAEIESDLWELQRDEDAGRRLTPALHILLRAIIGLPDDLMWSFEHLASGDGALPQTIAVTARVTGAMMFIVVLLAIAEDAGRRRSGFAFDLPEAPREGRVPLLTAGIVATVGPTMAADDEFEVASIKPNRSGAPFGRMTAEKGGRLTAVNVSLGTLIRYAYQRSDFEVSGGPTWMDSDRFDVVARAAADVPLEQIRLMLRSLLADRFGLRTHVETRETPVFALVMARDDRRFGPQLRRTEADCRNAPAPSPGHFSPEAPPACGFFGPLRSLSKLGFRGMAMTSVAGLLKPMVRRVVIDRTGLDGYFDGEFDFIAELGPPPLPPGVPDPFDWQSFPTVFTVLPEQLGLELESQRAAAEMVAIDSAWHPMPD